SHQQPRIRRVKLSAEQKRANKFAAVETMLKLMNEHGFQTLGEFLLYVFHNPTRGKPDPRGKKHSRVVARFLRGRTKIKMSDVFPLIYHHKASFPASKSVDVHEQKEMFAPAGPANQSNHARPYLSTWATHLIASEGRKEVGRNTRTDPDDAERQAQFRAQTNGRRDGARVVSWRELLSHFNLKWLGTQYYIHLPL
ncbi:hypothetical protein B0H14DRAFT_2183748, partial [Mycena olivaceomarginata]